MAVSGAAGGGEPARGWQLLHVAKVISANDFVSFVRQTIEVRKMLYALIKRLSGP
ncbi:MAG: hypothetical protein ACJ799_10555 [Gemmatimonadaceae bacterium]